MRSASIVFILSIAAAAPIVAAQKPAKSSDAPPELTGCVSDQPNPNGAFTFTDAVSGGKYRLSGKKLQKYAGKKVAVVSSQSKRPSVSGGLWPSPNVAAQAGALDPAQESIARQPGGGATAGTGNVELPELRVVRIRPVDGACR